MLNPFVKSGDPYMLVVGMAGVKMGDRLIQIGCEHSGRLGAVASRVGLTGHAVAVVPDERSAERARKGAMAAGVLVEVEVSPPTSLSGDLRDFHLAVVDDTGGVIGALPEAKRAAAIQEVARVLRPGGRVLFIGTGARAGLSGLFSKNAEGASFAAQGAVDALTANGFRSARPLAEREGLVFVEAIKPR